MNYFIALTLLVSLSACSESRSWSQTEELAASDLQVLNILVDSGNINIQSHEEPIIRVKSDFELRSPRKGKLAKEIRLEMIPAQKSVGILIKKPQMDANEILRSDLTLEIPSKLALELKTQNGNIAVTNQAGSITASSSNGNLNFQKITGNISANTQNGNLDLQDVSGNQHQLETTNGSINLQTIYGAVSSKSGNGSIKAFLKGVSRPEDYSFEASNGTISLHLPSDSSARIRYSQGTGNVNTSFKHLADQSQILVGEGTARIKIKSNNGNIEVLKD